MKAERLFGSRARGKNGILPMKMRAAGILRGASYSPHKTSTEPPNNLSNMCACAQENTAKFSAPRAEEFNTFHCVRCRTQAQNGLEGNSTKRCNQIKHKGLRRSCDEGHLAMVVQSQRSGCFSFERLARPS